MTGRLKGKVALISGAASGIAAACAAEFAAEGAKVVLGDIDAAGAKKLRKRSTADTGRLRSTAAST
jgi:3alpha(or 20beta)-hydroxysteroid dehydrogenase